MTRCEWCGRKSKTQLCESCMDQAEARGEIIEAAFTEAEKREQDGVDYCIQCGHRPYNGMAPEPGLEDGLCVYCRDFPAPADEPDHDDLED